MTNESNTDQALEELRRYRQALTVEEAPERVRARLLAEFRARHSQPEPVRRWWRTGAVAAALATVVVAVLVLRPGPRAPLAEPRLAREIATDYLPIGYAQPLDPDEFAQVVRISVPRSAMVRFGLPVEPGEGPDRVMADVVLGEDGIARAIRFVE